MEKRALRAVAVLVFLILISFASQKYDSFEIGNRSDVVCAIRDGYKHRAQNITLIFRARVNDNKGLKDLAAGLIEEAMEETGSADEGDYIRYQNGGYTLGCSVRKKGMIYEYELVITPDYYTYLYQEEYVDDEVDRIIRENGLLDMDEYEAAKCIYEYIYDTVSYDTVHKLKENNYLKNTAYSALYYHTAACQGYCLLFYRLCMEAGISCRVITGTYTDESGESERHAWNAVRIGDSWYAADVTVDKSTGDKRFFLCGSEDFTGHESDDKFLYLHLSQKSYNR